MSTILLLGITYITLVVGSSMGLITIFNKKKLFLDKTIKVAITCGLLSPVLIPLAIAVSPGYGIVKLLKWYDKTTKQNNNIQVLEDEKEDTLLLEDQQSSNDEDKPIVIDKRKKFKPVRRSKFDSNKEFKNYYVYGLLLKVSCSTSEIEAKDEIEKRNIYRYIIASIIKNVGITTLNGYDRPSRKIPIDESFICEDIVQYHAFDNYYTIPVKLSEPLIKGKNFKYQYFDGYSFLRLSQISYEYISGVEYIRLKDDKTFKYDIKKDHIKIGFFNTKTVFIFADKDRNIIKSVYDDSYYDYDKCLRKTIEKSKEKEYDNSPLLVGIEFKVIFKSPLNYHFVLDSIANRLLVYNDFIDIYLLNKSSTDRIPIYIINREEAIDSIYTNKLSVYFKVPYSLDYIKDKYGDLSSLKVKSLEYNDNYKIDLYPIGFLYGPKNIEISDEPAVTEVYNTDDNKLVTGVLVKIRNLSDYTISHNDIFKGLINSIYFYNHIEDRYDQQLCIINRHDYDRIDEIRIMLDIPLIKEDFTYKYGIIIEDTDYKMFKIREAEFVKNGHIITLAFVPEEFIYDSVDIDITHGPEARIV